MEYADWLASKGLEPISKAAKMRKPRRDPTKGDPKGYRGQMRSIDNGEPTTPGGTTRLTAMSKITPVPHDGDTIDVVERRGKPMVNQQREIRRGTKSPFDGKPITLRGKGDVIVNERERRGKGDFVIRQSGYKTTSRVTGTTRVGKLSPGFKAAAIGAGIAAAGTANLVHQDRIRTQRVGDAWSDAGRHYAAAQGAQKAGNTATAQSKLSASMAAERRAQSLSQPGKRGYLRMATGRQPDNGGARFAKTDAKSKDEKPKSKAPGIMLATPAQPVIRF